MEPAVFESLLEIGLEGLVIEGFGVGNITPGIVPAVERLLDEDIPVVITSRVPQGPLLGSYASEGGGGQMRSLGAILTGQLSSHKARIKLMLALGLTRDMDELQKIFTDKHNHPT